MTRMYSWNKIIFREYLLVDDIDLSHKVDAKSLNGAIRDYFMCHDVSMPVAKGHLKRGAFKNTIIEKYHTS